MQLIRMSTSHVVFGSSACRVSPNGEKVRPDTTAVVRVALGYAGKATMPGRSERASGSSYGRPVVMPNLRAHSFPRATTEAGVSLTIKD